MFFHKSSKELKSATRRSTKTFVFHSIFHFKKSLFAFYFLFKCISQKIITSTTQNNINRKCLWNYALLWLRSVEVHTMSSKWKLYCVQEGKNKDDSGLLSCVIKCRAIFHCGRCLLRQEIWSANAAYEMKKSRWNTQKYNSEATRVHKINDLHKSFIL